MQEHLDTKRILAAAGGSVGAWLAMRMFRHKTRKPVFMYGIPVILLCQMGLYTYFFIS